MDFKYFEHLALATRLADEHSLSTHIQRALDAINFDWSFHENEALTAFMLSAQQALQAAMTEALKDEWNAHRMRELYPDKYR